MAAHDGQQSRSVEDELHAEPWRFSFLQAVRLLEELAVREGLGARVPPAEGVHAEQEIVFFQHAVRFDAPGQDIEALDRDTHTLTVNVLGLAGALGPLPHVVTEALLDRVRSRDHAFADFLDIFNHRLIGLLYRARKRYRPALEPRGPHGGPVARVLYAMLGLGLPSLRDRVLPNDRALLPYAGLFSECFRFPAGLEQIIEHCFGVAAEIVPFVGAWNEVESADRTLLGVRNHILGSTALLGRRVWNQAARFEVRIGPLPFERFRDFLPFAHDAHGQLLSLIRFFADDELEFSVRLLLRAGDAPMLQLRRNGDAYLGHTTWLPAWTDEPRQYEVRLAGEA